MFINTLPLMFAEGGLFGAVEFLIVAACLYAVFYISAPFQDREISVSMPPEQGFFHYLYSGWFGESALPRVFWPFFAVLNAGLYAGDYWVWIGAISVSSWLNIHVMLLTPMLWWAVSIWRNAGSRTWLALSRLAVAGAFFEFAMRFYIYLKLPRLFFNCEELMLDYFSCF